MSGIDLPTETGAGGGGRLPTPGSFEVVDMETTERTFDDGRSRNYLTLSLLSSDDPDAEIQKVNYSVALTPEGKLNTNSNAGKLRQALDALDSEGDEGIKGSWEITGKTFQFEVQELPIERGPRAGETYTVFLPTALEGNASSSSSPSNGSVDGYTSEGVAALLALLDEPKAHATIFKEAGKVEAIRKDDKLYSDIVTQKAFTKIPGVKKVEGNKYVFGED